MCTPFLVYSCMKHILIVFVVLISVVHPWSDAACQSTTTDTIKSIPSKNVLLAYPIVYYQPETSWGFGGAGIFSFRFKGEKPTSNPSQIQFTAAYTLNKQVIFTLPFEMYARENAYKIKGELGYFRYFYNFFGIGGASDFDEREQYRVNFPRIRFDVLKHLGKSFLGLRYRFDFFNIKEIKEGGLLDIQNITGRDGGTISGIGLIWQYDTRNYLYNATKGMFVETEFYINNRWTFSDFSYQRLFINITLVGNAEGELITGDPIFYDMAYLGSPKLLRGYQDRRFIDKNLLAVQIELRYPLYRRFQGVSFTGIGNVGSTVANVFETKAKFTFGTGLRYIINRNDRIRIRLDYGRTLGEGGAFYLTINDAF
jgi:Omp85 superfamily domain